MRVEKFLESLTLKVFNSKAFGDYSNFLAYNSPVSAQSSPYRELLENYDNPEDPELINAVRNSIAKVNRKSIIADAITEYIKTQIENYGANGAQKGKEFNVNTRKWDAFKDFMSRFI